MALHHWENSFCLAAFIAVTVMFFSYMDTTNCSIFSNASSDRIAFSVPCSKKADVSVGNAVQVLQSSVFLSSQRMRLCHDQLQCEWQAKLLICLHRDLKQS